jgi:N-methylhydantoinase A
MKSNYRLGIDAGGTFTDFVLADKTGQVRLFKALSTPQDPTLAIKNGLALISEEMGVSAEEVVSNCDLCINGTTVGLNALITHKGAKTGLICTAGHEDSLEIRPQPCWCRALCAVACANASCQTAQFVKP